MLQRDRDGTGSESYESGTDHCGTGTGTGMTAAGTGRDREQRTSPVQNSSRNFRGGTCHSLKRTQASTCPKLIS